MRRIYFLILILLQAAAAVTGQAITAYNKQEVMIPMRDGVRLYTVIFTPKEKTAPLPFLLTRTPYSASVGDSFDMLNSRSMAELAKEGYIFVFQDIRGKYKSEGKMQIHQPIVHQQKKGAIDESTDTYDAIDWLIRNVGNNNGRAGITGISYPGWLALVGAVDAHPALKAASEQACMGDLFLGDDFHHNGAFRFSYGFEYTYMVESGKANKAFPFPSYDLYDWYLKLGSLRNVNEKYFHGTIPTWNDFVKHPGYDEFWKKNSPLSYVEYPEVPMLHVGGYYDQEDINGPQLMYSHMEKTDSANRNFIVLGPWKHGQWSGDKCDSLGRISFERKTGDDFRILQKKWFDYWLKGTGDGKFDEATTFQTGTNEWKSYITWPPKEAEIKKLYMGPDNKCTFEKPAAKGFVSYISDPAKPVPYRTLPIEATYGPGSRWGAWQVDDQRFAWSRPDVISFSSDTLTKDMAVTGKIKAHLIASTSGTDADWIVKLIDVYPAIDRESLSMSGYQFPVAMEVFRGRFRKSFSNPTPLVPGKAEEFVIDLHDINHVFQKGHKVMIQVQSTWFPLIDRNPQTFVPNIFEASESAFRKAEQRIYFSSYVELPVMGD